LGERRYTCDSNIGPFVAFGWIEGRFPLRRHLLWKEICHL
jgi:hypothetical protein